MKLAPRKESDIQRAILTHCNRLPGVVLWRANSGAVTATYKGKTRFIRFNGMPGMSDLIGWQQVRMMTADHVHHFVARVVAIEVKRPGAKLTPLQAGFLDMVRKAGGLAFVAISIDDVVNAGLR